MISNAIRRGALTAILGMATFVFAPVAEAANMPAGSTDPVVAAELPGTLVSDLSDIPEGYELIPFGDGSFVGVPDTPVSSGPKTPGGPVMTPNLSVGVGWGLYLYLNRTDQGALASGGAAALTIAICAIPAVGWGTCAIVAGVLVTAAYYISANGFCSNKLEIKLAVNSKAKCV